MVVVTYWNNNIELWMRNMVRQLWIFLAEAFQSFHSSSLSDGSCWSFAGSSSSPAMLEHVCHLLCTFRPLTMHVQSIVRPTSPSAFARQQIENHLGSWRSCHPIDHEAVIFTCRPSIPLLGLGVSGEFTKTPSPDGRLVVCSTCVLFERVLAWWKLCGFHPTSSTEEHLIPEFIDFMYHPHLIMPRVKGPRGWDRTSRISSFLLWAMRTMFPNNLRSAFTTISLGFSFTLHCSEGLQLYFHNGMMETISPFEFVVVRKVKTFPLASAWLVSSHSSKPDHANLISVSYVSLWRSHSSVILFPIMDLVDWSHSTANAFWGHHIEDWRIPCRHVLLSHALPTSQWIHQEPATVPVEMLTMSEGSFPKGFFNCFPRDRPLKQRPTNLSLCGSFLKISVLRDHTALNGDLLSQLPQCSCTMFSC